MANLMQHARLFTKRNSSLILTSLGAVGVVATSVMAAKATPKAMILLDKAEEEKGEELTKVEKVYAATPAYIPTVIMGATTITCIFSAHILNKRSQAAITSAYALLDSSYKEYRKKTVELYGEEADTKIKSEIVKDDYEDDNDIYELDEGKELFYDYFSGRYFQATKFDVANAAYAINRMVTMQDYAYLNDYYETLGLPSIEAGYELGWSPGGNLARYWKEWIDFDHETMTTDDGMECTIVSFVDEPYLDFADYI